MRLFSPEPGAAPLSESDAGVGEGGLAEVGELHGPGAPAAYEPGMLDEMAAQRVGVRAGEVVTSLGPVQAPGHASRPTVRRSSNRIAVSVEP